MDAGVEAPANVRRLAAHFGDLVRFASQVEAGRARMTPVRCRRRPRRRGCDGLLVVEWEESTKQVTWHCPKCPTAGVITGWTATQADLRAMRRGRRQGVREVVVTVEAISALREVARVDPELGRLAFTAEIRSNGNPVLFISKEERERCRSRLAGEALRAESKRAAGHLMTLVEALTEPAAAAGGEGGFVQIDASDAQLFLQRLLDLPDAKPPENVLTNARRRPVRIKSLRRASAQTFQIKVSLRDVRPPIWRRLLVPSDILLPKLHQVLQAAMGWHDSHLHLFRVGNDCYAPPGDWEPLGRDSRGVALADLAPRRGARLVYEYDFGDGWTHDIVVESVSPEPCDGPRCTGGRRRCPPEDCGGPWGYAEFMEAIADQSHERHDELREWCGDSFDHAEFDVESANASLRGQAGD